MIEAARYYEARRLGLGKSFLDQVEIAEKQILEAPERFSPIGGRFRRFRLRRFPYGIVYAVEEDGIFVAAVMHLRRRPGYWEGRARV